VGVFRCDKDGGFFPSSVPELTDRRSRNSSCSLSGSLSRSPSEHSVSASPSKDSSSSEENGSVQSAKRQAIQKAINESLPDILRIYEMELGWVELSPQQKRDAFVRAVWNVLSKSPIDLTADDSTMVRAFARKYHQDPTASKFCLMCRNVEEKFLPRNKSANDDDDDSRKPGETHTITFDTDMECEDNASKCHDPTGQADSYLEENFAHANKAIASDGVNSDVTRHKWKWHDLSECLKKGDGEKELIKLDKEHKDADEKDNLARNPCPDCGVLCAGPEGTRCVGCYRRYKECHEDGCTKVRTRNSNYCVEHLDEKRSAKKPALMCQGCERVGLKLSRYRGRSLCPDCVKTSYERVDPQFTKKTQCGCVLAVMIDPFANPENQYAVVQCPNPRMQGTGQKSKSSCEACSLAKHMPSRLNVVQVSTLPQGAKLVPKPRDPLADFQVSDTDSGASNAVGEHHDLRGCVSSPPL